MADPIAVLRTSHDRFAALVDGLDEQGVTQMSYASEWTIADVASHLGSGAEIFALFLEAGLQGEDPPGGEAFGPIWDRWNATPPVDQVGNSVAVNESFVSRLEGLSADERDSVHMEMFGMPADLAFLCTMRLGEHAVHTWDVAVALDPSATVAADAAELILPGIGFMIGRAMKPVENAGTVTVRTPSGDRSFDLGEGKALDEGTGDTTVTMSDEAFLRLVYGRLDADHTPSDVEGDLTDLRAAFPGF